MLNGCAALPARTPDEVAHAWAMRQQMLAPLTNWELRGRIALRSRDEGMQASLHWVRERERQRISLVGPLGSGQVRLTQDASGAELRDTEKNVRRAPTVRQLLVETTGWDVPLDDMDWWVRGLPAPGAKAEQELDEDGRLKTLTQLGWEVEFLEYDRYGVRTSQQAVCPPPRERARHRARPHDARGARGHRALDVK